MKMRSYQQLHRLSFTAIKHINKSGWHGDGGGLFLEVDKTGAKRWAMRLTINGKRRDFGLGPIHKVSLQNARMRAAEYREKAYLGIDPIEGKEKRRSRGKMLSGLVTFEQAADEAHRTRKGLWSNGKHVEQWINTLNDYAFPVFGTKAVRDVGTADVLEALSKIWTTKPETARRLRQRIRTVLDWARAAGHRSGDNPIDLIGQALPRHAHKVSHHDALPYNDVADFIALLRECRADDVTKVAFEFLILTAARTREVRLATWSEIDLQAGLWTLPPHRMKARREHVVPLPARAVDILKVRRSVSRPDATGATLIFTDSRTDGALSENRFLNARDAMGYADRCTAHGFRSSFRDWAAEETTFPAEVVEMALAHTIVSKTEAAYRRGDLLAKRRNLMQAWSDYILRNRKPPPAEQALTS